MWRFIYSTYLKLTGWKIVGGIDPDIPKYIAVVAPHTSNIDFVIGVMVRSVVGVSDAKYLGKSQLFKWPYGWLFRKLGGYPVKRTGNDNWVDSAVKIFNEHERFAIGLAPEGTRSKVDRLKTGFYYIAKKANIPIILVGFDFSTKTIVIKEPFYCSDSIENDFKKIIDFFAQYKGKNPELGVDRSLYDKMFPGEN